MCPKCKIRIKDWNGDDPKCAFPENTFISENWNCATMNELRDLAQDTNQIVWSEDHSCAALVVPGEPCFIILGWYKSRGQTEYASLLQGQNCELLPLAYAEKTLTK
jgi:hypothetical protein